MKCGRCHSDGPLVTVAHVRACYGATADKPAPKLTVTFPKIGRFAVNHEGKMVHFLVREAKKANAWTVCTLHGDIRTFRGLIFADGGTTCKGGSRSAILEVAYAPAEAAILYGKTTGHCSICGKALTDEKSVELGIGPVCAKANSWVMTA